MFDNKYPYTDFSQLNLDWFLNKFKDLLAEQQRVSGLVQDLDETVQQFTAFVTSYFDNLDVQQEINNKLDAMVADGTLSALIAPLVGDDIQDSVTEWLNENVDPVGSAVIVDNTLSISGAAADAKTAGDAIRLNAGNILTLQTAINGVTALVTPALPTDTTLSTTGKAADAKATGDAINLNAGNIIALQTAMNGVTALVNTALPADNTLSISAKAADAKATGDAINAEKTYTENTYAKKDGTYDLLTSGYAGNLTPYSSESGTSQNTPFILQGSGCANGEEQADTGSYCQLKEKKGNTVVVNQLMDFSNDTTTINDVTFTKSTDGTVTVNGTASADTTYTIVTSSSTTPTHKMLLRGCPSGGSASTYFMVDAWNYSNAQDIGNGVVYTEANTAYDVRIIVKSGTQCNNLVFRPRLTDLTLWFGSNDKIPTYLLNHPEDFFRYYQGDLSYNAGTLTDSNGRYLKTTGRNVWDEDWESGSYAVDTGLPYSDNTRIRTKNYVRCIPNMPYYVRTNSKTIGLRFYDANKTFLGSSTNISIDNGQRFTAPANACYFRFTVVNETTYHNDITISLYYEGESGYDQYYPYEELANIDTGDEPLLAFDWKEPNGTIHHDTLPKIDMGTLSFLQTSTGTHSFFCILNKPSANKNVLCSKYPVNQTTYGSTSGMDVLEASYDKEMFVAAGSSRMFIVDSAFAGYTGEQVAAALSGVMLEAEAADSAKTTEQGTPFPENVAIDDFGTMSFDCPNGVPQGNLIFYPVDYKAEIDTLHNITEGDMHKIALKGELAEGEPETIEEVVDYINARIPAPPAEDGTYNLTVTVASGEATYSWVSAT